MKHESRKLNGMPVAAILLAAGNSSRLGEPKQLLRLNGETLLARTVRLAKEAGLAPIVVVLGAQAERFLAEATLHGAQVVVNGEWEQGISTSILAGLSALEASGVEPDGAMILCCDQPRLSATHLRALLDSFLAQREPALVASFYAGARGVPAIFHRKAFPILRTLKGDKGAKGLLQSDLFPVISLPFDGGEIDIDLPSDLARLG